MRTIEISRRVYNHVLISAGILGLLLTILGVAQIVPSWIAAMIFAAFVAWAVIVRPTRRTTK